MGSIIIPVKCMLHWIQISYFQSLDEAANKIIALPIFQVSDTQNLTFVWLHLSWDDDNEQREIERKMKVDHIIEQICLKQTQFQLFIHSVLIRAASVNIYIYIYIYIYKSCKNRWFNPGILCPRFISYLVAMSLVLWSTSGPAWEIKPSTSAWHCFRKICKDFAWKMLVKTEGQNNHQWF